MSITFDSTRIANLIILKGTWDNCKVQLCGDETACLRSIIEPYMPLQQELVLGAWDVAVNKAHAAVVDYRKTDLAIKNTMAYCVTIFRENLSRLKQLEEMRRGINL